MRSTTVAAATPPYGVRSVGTVPSTSEAMEWTAFVADVRRAGVEVQEGRVSRTIFVTDAGGLARGMPNGVVAARSAEDVSAVLRAAQCHRVPVTTRGGGLTTDGESVAAGGCLLNMNGLNRVLALDAAGLTVRVEAGIYWHTLAEHLRRSGLDYISAPLNFTSSVGGTLGVGGIDANSCKHGCSADQVVALRVVTPTGEIVECSERQRPDLFERVLLGYGQFGVIVEAELRIREYTPIAMHYWLYSSLREAVEDYVALVQGDGADYAGILTVNERAITLFVAFDSDARERAFMTTWAPRLRGGTLAAFAARMLLHYLPRPRRWGEARVLALRARRILLELYRPEHTADGKQLDRTVLFSRAVWTHWGNRQMVNPDLATTGEKFARVVERGAAVCREYFPFYSLYIVSLRIQPGRPRYELSLVPSDAKDWAFGCSFEPTFRAGDHPPEHLQAFKNAIYDLGVELGTSYYRFGGAMKGYVRRALGDAVVDRHLAMKRTADPGMILNPNVVF